MECPGCQAPNREGALFCRECGRALGGACPRCGGGVEPGSVFCDACGTPVARPREGPGDRFKSPKSYTPPHLIERILSVGRTLEGERKQVTVLFCDIAGSIALAERLGAEAMHGLLNAFFELILAEVHRYEGTVNQFLGDGFMALFGAPLAHEDHARRAALAAVSIRRALAERRGAFGIPPESDLSLRMGLNTGTVVVGRIGDNLRMDYTAVGDTTHLAARLQQLAEPGTILMSEATHRLVAGTAESRFAGEREIRGWPARVPVYHLDGVRPAPRFALAQQRGLTPLVGRDAELEALEAAFRDTAAGSLSAIDLVGEAGIGKSRVAYELRRRLPAGTVCLQVHCTAYGRTTAFLPFAQTLRIAFEIGEADGPAVAREKLRRGLTALGLEARAELPFLLTLLGLEGDADALRGLDGEIVGARTREALLALLRARCRLSPTVLLVDDAHWIDRASEEFLLGVVDGVEAMPLLVICVYRPEYRPPWAGRPSVRELRLGPLSAERCRELVRHQLGGAAAPEAVVQRLAEESAGNPLFAEEMVRYLEESGRLERTDRGVVLRGDGPAIGVPATLHDLVMARVDRLAEPHRALLQVAAVIGRRFPVALLAATTGGANGLAGLLRDLEAQALLARDEEAGQECRFKHVLIQEAVYGSLLRPRREELHRRVGEAIERLYADRLGEWTEVLAHHYGQTPHADRAVRYLVLAGEKSLRVYSLEEAHARFSQALELVDTVPGSADMAFVGDALLAWVRVYYYRKDFRGLVELVERYLPRIEAADDRRLLSLALFWLGFAHVMGARGGKARPLLERALSLGEALGAEECIGYASMGLLYHYAYWERPLGEARERAERFGLRALESARRLNDVYLASKCLLGLAVHAAMLGRPDEGRETGRRLVELGRAAGDPRTTAMGLYALAYVNAGDERFEEALAQADEAERLSPDPMDQLTARGARGTILALTGQPQEGLALLREVRRETLAGDFHSLLLGLDIPYGMAMILAGELGAGVRWIEAAMGRFAAWGNGTGVALGHIGLGEIYLQMVLRQARPTLSMLVRNLGFVLRTLPFAGRKARQQLEAGIRLCRELGMTVWLARGLLDLGLLGRAERRLAEARRSLEEARELAGRRSPVLAGRVEAALAALGGAADRGTSTP
jgi:class 3 adenylate cyclase/tetratricopeptide (TPR) repeat protein